MPVWEPVPATGPNQVHWEFSVIREVDPVVGRCLRAVWPPQRCHASLTRHIVQLQTGSTTAGRHGIDWDGRDAAGKLVPPGALGADSSFHLHTRRKNVP